MCLFPYEFIRRGRDSESELVLCERVCVFITLLFLCGTAAHSNRSQIQRIRISYNLNTCAHWTAGVMWGHVLSSLCGHKSEEKLKAKRIQSVVSFSTTQQPKQVRLSVCVWELLLLTKKQKNDFRRITIKEWNLFYFIYFFFCCFLVFGKSPVANMVTVPAKPRSQRRNVVKRKITLYSCRCRCCSGRGSFDTQSQNHKI